jgi:hypothetical protein
MPSYPFLSDAWFDAVEQLLAEEGAVDAEVGDLGDLGDMVVNATVTATPFGADRELHLGAIDGNPVWGHGHTEPADLVIVTDYATARQIFLGGDPQAVMQAFLLGKLVVSGDLGKLVERVQGGAGGALPVPPELAGKLLALTE